MQTPKVSLDELQTAMWSSRVIAEVRAVWRLDGIGWFSSLPHWVMISLTSSTSSTAPCRLRSRITSIGLEEL
ncbi:hypothetical protein LINPERHAP1_LOCUS17745, partial [Linum perenne]